MKEFKGTPVPWFVTEFAGFHKLMDGKYYEDNDILDQDQCIHAAKNAQLASCAPELLKVLQEIIDVFPNENIEQQNLKVMAVELINKAIL